MKKSVLVVEDDSQIRDLVQLILQHAGYDVIAAQDGAEAMEQLEHGRPSLIVLDLMLPQMSGLKFAEQLRQRGLRPGIPVLVMTAASQAWHKASWIDAEGCIEKPFKIPALLDTVSRLAPA